MALSLVCKPGRMGAQHEQSPEPTRPTILVVDDEESIRDAVASALRYEHFEVRVAASGGEALASIAESAPDLIVLDWMLPDLTGVELERNLRARGLGMPILFLSARDAIEDKVDALGAGADDYMTKPFSLAEVVARIHALLRRKIGDVADDVLRFADVTLKESRQMVMRGNTAVALSMTEFSILRFFLLHPRQIVSNEQILQDVWLSEFDGSANVVETYIASLCRKLDTAGLPLIRAAGRARYVLDAA
jgi:two-component system, OmpR family, response regulator